MCLKKKMEFFPLTLLLSAFWPYFPAPPLFLSFLGRGPAGHPPFPPSLFLSPTSGARLSAPSLPNHPLPLPFLCRSGTASSFPRSHDLPMPRARAVSLLPHLISSMPLLSRAENRRRSPSSAASRPGASSRSLRFRRIGELPLLSRSLPDHFPSVSGLPSAPGHAHRRAPWPLAMERASWTSPRPRRGWDRVCLLLLFLPVLAVSILVHRSARMTNSGDLAAGIHGRRRLLPPLWPARHFPPLSSLSFNLNRPGSIRWP